MHHTFLSRVLCFPPSLVDILNHPHSKIAQLTPSLPEHLVKLFSTITSYVQMSRGGGDYRDAFRSTGTYAEQETGERAFVAGHSVPLSAFIDAFMMNEDDGMSSGASAGVTAYLAQHDLLAQCGPELSDACSPAPKYVGLDVAKGGVGGLSLIHI